MKEIVLSYSCGKDSVLALHRLKERGYRVKALLVTVDEGSGKSFFHHIPQNLLSEIGKSLNIEVKPIISRGEDYRRNFLSCLIALKKEGIFACGFGDIDIRSHRLWCEELCRDAGIEALFPLWNESREDLVREVIELGYCCRLQKVRSSLFCSEVLESPLDFELIEEMKQRGIDICGENGEYHTFVTDGPLFETAVPYRTVGILREEETFSLLLDRQ